MMDTNTKPGFVVDASYMLAFLLPDERNEEVENVFIQFLRKEVLLCCPPILIYEVTNGLASAVKRKRITSQFASHLADHVKALEITTNEVNMSKTLEIALKKNISVYDASYIELSKKNKLQLLTFDESLQKAAN